MANQRKRAAEKAARAAEKAAKKHPKLFLLLVIVVLVIALVAGAYWYFFVYKKESPTPSPSPSPTPTPSPSVGTLKTGELGIHFLELGNKYTGDCIYIQIGSVDILIDGGSRAGSAATIANYVNQYCTDGILEYVIVTHADQDHIAAFAATNGLFRRFECKTIIDFPRTGKNTQVYQNYVKERDAEVEAGATHYTALQCWNQTDGAKRSYELAEGVTMNFLYNYYYEHDTNDENNYSVCMYIKQGEYNYLFTGDLEEDGERRLIENNELPQCKLFKAGHHGSKTSSTEALLSVIKPECVCVCCCAGSNEYNAKPENTFPTQAMISRVMKYTQNIYVTSLADESLPSGYTSMNGNIVVKSDGVDFSVTGSANSTLLKDTAWFKENRVWN